MCGVHLDCYNAVYSHLLYPSNLLRYRSCVGQPAPRVGWTEPRYNYTLYGHFIGIYPTGPFLYFCSTASSVFQTKRRVCDRPSVLSSKLLFQIKTQLLPLERFHFINAEQPGARFTTLSLTVTDPRPTLPRYRFHKSSTLLFCSYDFPRLCEIGFLEHFINVLFRCHASLSPASLVR